jgi:hypothetical protein
MDVAPISMIWRADCKHSGESLVCTGCSVIEKERMEKYWNIFWNKEMEFFGKILKFVYTNGISKY